MGATQIVKIPRAEKAALNALINAFERLEALKPDITAIHVSRNEAGNPTVAYKKKKR